jgi:hypothetical protein
MLSLETMYRAVLVSSYGKYTFPNPCCSNHFSGGISQRVVIRFSISPKYCLAVKLPMDLPLQFRQVCLSSAYKQTFC